MTPKECLQLLIIQIDITTIPVKQIQSGKTQHKFVFCTSISESTD